VVKPRQEFRDLAEQGELKEALSGNDMEKIQRIFKNFLVEHGAAPSQSEKETKGDNVMSTYIIFSSLTQKGVEKIKESPSRVEAAKKTINTMGGEVKAFYAILGGQYDTLLVVEAPNDEAIAKMALAIGSLGNVRTDTHRVFTEEEFEKIVSALP
jgi:uncharacterized protein with GYD domain